MLDSFFTLMARGGPVMWIIFVTAWIAFIMLAERAVQIQLWVKQALHDQQGLESNPSYQPQIPRGRNSSPIAVLLYRLNWKEIRNRSDLAKQLNIQLTELMPRLEGTLPTIAIIGSLLPMLGLLGTVIGMIDVFEVIARHGTGDPMQMAHGISQALLTTASGLICAIPVIFIHHLLVRRLGFLMAVTEQSMLILYNRHG
ncbi:MAG TPA: MotA/TolQ/ExbB proton channel family protein [Gammaproteobacteria bacterium]|nr:MotA/TolQ/ExbB proton channel family protein [Gammaproteobacteria bacterium]